MKKDFAFALVLVAAGIAVTAACSSSSKDKDSKTDGGAGAGAAGGAGGLSGASGSAGSGGGPADGGGAAGRGGSGGTAGGAAGTGGSGGCSMDLEACEVNGDCCGFSAGDNVCVDTGDPQLGTACLIVCTANSECQSGCCAALEGGSARVCGPASLCGGGGDSGVCADDLEPCETNGDCCGFASGQNFCVDTGTPPPTGLGVACLIACTSGTQCQSGCCAPLEGGMGSVCGPAELCQ